MPVTVQERENGRRQKLGEAERLYVIKGATTDAEALTGLLAAAPLTVGTLVLLTSECDVDEIAENLYIGTARYGATGVPGNNQQPGSFSISFDISGQSQRITQSIENRAYYYAPGKPIRNFKGAINVNADGSVDGVDIIIPYLSFVLNYTVDPSLINDAYIAQLAELVGTVNDGPFKTFDTGELLFTKVSGSKRDTQAWDISFAFSVSKNKVDLTVGDISIPFKYGWDYLWIYYDTEEDTTNKCVLKRPANAFLEKVYPGGNYSLLGLP